MKPIAILGLLMLLFAGCNKLEEVNESEYAELTFKIVTSQAGARSNVSENPNDISSWTDAEKAVDGRFIYDLSVYLIDENKNIVRSKNISFNEETAVAYVTFDKLNRGDYTIMAVANKELDNSSLKNNWKDNTYEELMTNMIGITSDNVSSKDVVQPLSYMNNITLQLGKNQVMGELKRSFSRLRIVVENNSTYPLSINSLALSDNFTQKQTYVFDDGTGGKYTFAKGAPVTTSQYALQPFVADEGKDYMEISSYNSKVVFDGYVLESKLTGDDLYKYTLDLQYNLSNNAAKSRATVGTWTEIRTPSEVVNGDYIISNYDNYYFLTASSQSSVGSYYASKLMNETEVDDVHIWEIERDGAYFYIKNKGTGMYLQNPTTSSIGLGDTRFGYTFEEKLYSGKNYVLMKGSTNYIYLNYWIYGTSYNSSSSNCLVLYKANTSEKEEIITYNEPITMVTIDPVSMQASATKEIKRNDFINVHVTVSYNNVAGQIEYVVDDWNKVEGDVTFD